MLQPTGAGTCGVHKDDFVPRVEVPELKYQLNMVQFIFTRLDTLNFNMFVIISYCSFKYVNSESFKLIQ